MTINSMGKMKAERVERKKLQWIWDTQESPHHVTLKLRPGIEILRYWGEIYQQKEQSVQSPWGQTTPRMLQDYKRSQCLEKNERWKMGSYEVRETMGVRSNALQNWESVWILSEWDGEPIVERSDQKGCGLTRITVITFVAVSWTDDVKNHSQERLW